MSAKVYPSMVDAKQSDTQSLSWFRPRGRTSSSGVLEALYCSAPRVPVVGLLQAMRERKRGSQVPGEDIAEDIVGELESEYGECRVLFFCLVPLRRGSSSSFYRPRRERITCMPHYLATWGSVVCYAVE
jgi:hypothetical protein